jgi:hypothetical protein
MTLEKHTATKVRQIAVFQQFANFEHHFVGVNKMVLTRHSGRAAKPTAEAWELEAKIAKNVVEILETA